MTLLEARSTWVVARLGAAMHYAVPRILHRAGRLERFYTDVYAAGIARKVLSLIPEGRHSPALNRALGRVASDEPQNLIRSYPFLGLEYFVRQAVAKNIEARDKVFLWAGRKFGSS